MLAAIALLATASLIGGPPLRGPVAAPEPAETTRLQALEDAFKQIAPEQAAMRAELDRYRAWIDTMALPIRNLPATKGSFANIAPTSSLDRAAASRAAMAARLMVSGGGALNVLPTGSMRPTFDQNAILLTEPARFDDIYITRENFDRRVFGIFCGRESAATPLA